MNERADFVSLVAKIYTLPPDKQEELIIRLNDIVTGYQLAQKLSA